jgi:hypothetical protein
LISKKLNADMSNNCAHPARQAILDRWAPLNMAEAPKIRPEPLLLRSIDVRHATLEPRLDQLLARQLIQSNATVLE